MNLPASNKIIGVIFLMVLTLGCDLDSGQNKPNATLIRDDNGKIVAGELTRYFKNGKVASIMNFKDGKLDGKAVKYYDDGVTMRSELIYAAGRLAGVQKRFYKSGALYKEEMYLDGKRNGLTKKYREGGMLMTEAIFRNGFASTDMKEYLTNGKLKKKYPLIIIEEDDQLARNGTYELNIFLSDKTQKVEFYLGQLEEGKYFHSGLERQHNIEDGVLTFTIRLSRGEIASGQYDIVAKVITRLNNVYLISRQHQVKIRY